MDALRWLAALLVVLATAMTTAGVYALAYIGWAPMP
jgi:hypothetical protein